MEETHILHGITEFTKNMWNRLSNDNKVRRTIHLELPAGTYTAREMKVMRYSLSITEISGGVRALDTVEFDLIQTMQVMQSLSTGKMNGRTGQATSVCENIILKRER